jgi:GDP-L-fucose synthase
MAQAVVFALENTLPDYLYNVGQEKIWPSNNWLKPFKNNDIKEKSFRCTKPDGTPRKLMDISKMHANGNTKDLEEGIQKLKGQF